MVRRDVGEEIVSMRTTHAWRIAAGSAGAVLAAVHHANPYVVAPAAYGRDPVLHLVTAVWRHTPSRYGTLFTGLSAVGSWLGGANALALRLWFQGIALVAVAGIAAILWRRTRST